MQKSERIVSYSGDELEAMIARGEDMTDWARVDALTYEEIEASIDYEEEGHFDLERGRAKPDRPRPESIGIDDDVHEWFKGEYDYVSLMNTILRRWMVAHPRADELETDVAPVEAVGAGERKGEAA